MRGSAIVTGLPATGSVPGLQLYSTWHWPHCSLVSYLSRMAILRVKPRWPSSFTSTLPAFASLCHSVSFSGRVSAWMRPSRMTRGCAPCGSWQKMQLSEWFTSFTNSFTFESRLHFAFGSGSPR